MSHRFGICEPAVALVLVRNRHLSAFRFDEIENHDLHPAVRALDRGLVSALALEEHESVRHAESRLDMEVALLEPGLLFDLAEERRHRPLPALEPTFGKIPIPPPVVQEQKFYRVFLGVAPKNDGARRDDRTHASIFRKSTTERVFSMSSRSAHPRRAWAMP